MIKKFLCYLVLQECFYHMTCLVAYVIYFNPIITMEINDNLTIFKLGSTCIPSPVETWFRLISLVFLGCRPIINFGSPLQPSTEHRQAWVKSATREYLDCLRDLFIQFVYLMFCFAVIFLQPSWCIPRILKPWSSSPAQLFATKEPVMLTQCLHPPAQSCRPLLHSTSSNWL